MGAVSEVKPFAKRLSRLQAIFKRVRKLELQVLRLGYRWFIALRAILTLPANTLSFLREFYEEGQDHREEMRLQAVDSVPLKLIAFYLPQYHPTPENDRSWGKGFTDWVNVTRAKPQYLGHYQPHIPDELGFYDLRLIEVQKRQVELAKHYGVYGFCYYYYWFAGKSLLDLPLRRLLEHQELDMPFCICWANENWTRRWDGQEHEVIIAQDESPKSAFKLIESVEDFLRDRRYIRISGMPLFIVYRPDIIPSVKEVVSKWRAFCAERGIGAIYLVGAKTFGLEDPTQLGFDAAVEFPPHGVHASNVTWRTKVLNRKFEGYILSYEDTVRQAKLLTAPGCPTFRTVMPGWDNTARRGKNAFVFAGSSPELYGDWLDAACDWTTKYIEPSKWLVFVNAWNEWAEGAHLEPDKRYGYAYLNATATMLSKFHKSTDLSLNTQSTNVTV
jgi:lipopolysaccharide biosynthesis protein